MGDSATIQKKLARLAQQYRNTWQRPGAIYAFDQPLPVTCQLTLFRDGQEQKGAERSFPDVQEAIQHAVEQGGRVILVEAGPGEGKTSTLLWAAHLACQRLAENGVDDRSHLPFFFDLGSAGLKDGEKITLKSLLAHRKKWMRGHSGLFFLDGFDLLPSTSFDLDARTLLKQVEEQQDEEEHAFVLSGRPLDKTSSLSSDWEELWHISLTGLDPRVIREWLESQASPCQKCSIHS